MRIAFLTAEYPPQIGGVGDYTHCLAHELAAHGHTVAVVTGAVPSPLKGEVVAPAAECQQHRLQHIPTISGWGWRCWRDTIAALDMLRPDILHIQYQTGAYAMHPAINLLPCRLRGLPHHSHIVVTFHDLLEPYLFPKAGALRRWVTLRLARDTDGVIVTNAEDRANLPLTPTLIPIGSNIAKAPPPGYQRDDWRKRIGVQPGELLVAYFGLLSRSKGVDVLLDALKSLLHARLPLRLLLIGGAAATPHDHVYADEVARQVERLGLDDNIIRTGHVDAVTVSAHLLAADCVVLPFRSGASFRSGSLLAAVTHGVPVITTTPPAGVSPHLVHGENVLLVLPEQRGALAAALQQLASDTALRTRLASGAERLGAQFSWSTIAQQHTDFYSSLKS